jgi:hypothetical protein
VQKTAYQPLEEQFAAGSPQEEVTVQHSEEDLAIKSPEKEMAVQNPEEKVAFQNCSLRLSRSSTHADIQRTVQVQRKR